MESQQREYLADLLKLYGHHESRYGVAVGMGYGAECKEIATNHRASASCAASAIISYVEDLIAGNI